MNLTTKEQRAVYSGLKLLMCALGEKARKWKGQPQMAKKLHITTQEIVRVRKLLERFN